METTKSMIKPKTNEKDTITTKSSNFYLKFKRDAENFNFSLFLPEPKPITTMKDANFKLSSTFVTDALSPSMNPKRRSSRIRTYSSFPVSNATAIVQKPPSNFPLDIITAPLKSG